MKPRCEDCRLLRRPFLSASILRAVAHFPAIEGADHLQLLDAYWYLPSLVASSHDPSASDSVGIIVNSYWAGTALAVEIKILTIARRGYQAIAAFASRVVHFYMSTVTLHTGEEGCGPRSVRSR